MKTSYLCVPCAIVTSQLAAMAQAGWVQASTGQYGLAPRELPAMAFDSTRNRTVMFGGRGSGGDLGETWLWNGTYWAQASVAGPAARYAHAIVFDDQRARVILFGGLGSTGSAPLLTDTWEWDGATWTQVATTGPGDRNFPAMAFDSNRGKAVLFGGVRGSGTILGDTWEWNGLTWNQASSTGPAGRFSHAMAYDSIRGKVVLFGGAGFGTNTTFSDTWEWDGASWAHAAASGPSGRNDHSMVYDSVRRRTVLFGGAQGTVYPALLNDTWEWDGTTWVQVATTGPDTRYGHAMSYDSARGWPVVFGGRSNFASYYGDTWEYRYSPTGSAASQPYGTGCGAPALQLSPTANGQPVINTAAQATLSNVPASLAFLALGWSRTMAGPFPLPIHMAGYGLPGCYMLQSTDAAAQPTTLTGPGVATYSLALPNWSGLIGLHVYLQGWAPAPGANPGGVIVSNGLDWLIGY